MLAQPSSDPERLASRITAVAGHLSDAMSPAVLVDLDADRFGVAAQITALAAKLQLPVAVSNTAKAAIEETFPYQPDVALRGDPTQSDEQPQLLPG